MTERDRLPETLRADIDLCRRDIDDIGERLNKLERPADIDGHLDQAQKFGEWRERAAIVKWLRDGDRSCDCCGLTREVNHIEGSPSDFDQLCPECHFTKRHIAKSIEDGDHLKGSANGRA